MNIRNLLCIALLPLVSAVPSHADRGNFLNYAILTIPAKFLADIPFYQRDDLLKQCSYESDDTHLDYRHGYLAYSSDSEEPPNASSMFYLKVLPTDSPFQAPVFIHMQKPFNGHKPSKDDTYVLEYMGRDEGWVDITDRVFPSGIDRKSYFHPLRESVDIEVAPWVRRSKGIGYDYGECKTLLRWNGKAFDKISIKPRKAGYD